MRIPKEFDLGPHHVTVRLNDGMWEKEKKVGTADVGHQKIYLQSVIPGMYNRSCTEQAFWHEFFHMLLFYAGQRELYTDEVLVDCLGSLMMQFMKTKKGTVI